MPGNKTITEIITKAVDFRNINSQPIFTAKTTVCYDDGCVDVEFADGKTRHKACQNSFDIMVKKLGELDEGTLKKVAFLD